MSDEKNTDNNKVNVDLNLGGLLGGGLGKLVDLASQLSENGEEIKSRLEDLENGISSEQQFTTKGGANGVFGFQVKTIGGQQRVQTFGNIKKEKEADEPSVSAVREPLVDIIEADDKTTIIAEMPGVQEDAITLTPSGQQLTLEAEGFAGRRYEKIIDLSVELQEENITHSYQNGILEITVNHT